MAYGNLNVDVVQSSTAGTPPQFNDGNGTQTGTLCRAWVNLNGSSGASPVIRSSFNVSSVVRNSTGNYTVTFTNALSDSNYSAVFGINGRAVSTYQLTTIDTVTNSTGNVAFTLYGTPNGTSVGVASADSAQISVAIFR